MSWWTTATTRTFVMPDSDGTLALATGIAGGQTIIGGTASGDDLTLESTSDVTKGFVFINPTSGKVIIGGNSELNPGATEIQNQSLLVINDINLNTFINATNLNNGTAAAAVISTAAFGLGSVDIISYSTAHSSFSDENRIDVQSGSNLKISQALTDRMEVTVAGEITLTPNSFVDLTGKLTLSGDDAIIRRSISSWYFAEAGNETTTGTNNFGAGNGALDAVTSGGSNVAVGTSALSKVTTTGSSIGIGPSAFLNLAFGANNIGIGGLTGASNTGGSDNIFIGDAAAQSCHVNASRNVVIGKGGGTDCGDDNVFIGHQVGSTLTNPSDLLWIANSNTTSPLIEGDFAASSLKINGTLESVDVAVFPQVTVDNLIINGNTISSSTGDINLNADVNDDVRLLVNGASSQLVLIRETATTNAIEIAAKIRHETSGTPAAGIGASIQLESEVRVGTYRAGAEIQGEFSNVGAGTEVSDFIVNTFQAGSITESIRFDGSAVSFDITGAISATSTITAPSILTNSIDRASAGNMTIGGTTANIIQIGRTAETTSVLGTFAVAESAAITGNLSATGAVTTSAIGGFKVSTSLVIDDPVDDGTVFLRNIDALDQTTTNTIKAIAENTQTGTSYTLTASDMGKRVLMVNAGAITVTLPEDSTEDLVDGFNCLVHQGTGGGQVTFVVEGTDTLVSADSVVKTRTENVVIFVTKENSGEWLISGDLTA